MNSGTLSVKNLNQKIRGSSSEEQLKKLKIRLSRNSTNNNQSRDRSNERPISFLQNFPLKGITRTESNEKQQSYNNYFHLKGGNNQRFTRKNQSTVLNGQGINNFKKHNDTSSAVMRSQELYSAKTSHSQNHNNTNDENLHMKFSNTTDKKNGIPFFSSPYNSGSFVKSGTQRALTENDHTKQSHSQNNNQLHQYQTFQQSMNQNSSNNKSLSANQNFKNMPSSLLSQQQQTLQQSSFTKKNNFNNNNNNNPQTPLQNINSQITNAAHPHHHTQPSFPQTYQLSQSNNSSYQNYGNQNNHNTQPSLQKQSQSFVGPNFVMNSSSHSANRNGSGSGQRNKKSNSNTQHSTGVQLPYIVPQPYIEPLNPNCTIYLIYKKNKLMLQFNVQDKTTNWLKQQLLIKCVQFERDNQNPNAEQDLNRIVGFQSANKNISVSYYLTLANKDLDIFKMATLSVEPIFTDKYFPQQEKINLQHFNLVKCIGLGGFSRVYLVQKKDTGVMYALKLIDKSFIIKNKKEVIVQNERNIMTCINHPYLLKLEYAFESKSYLGFAMEYCAGGELFFHLRRIKRMNEDQARFYFTEICLGIQYLHDRAIIYRDIKPENILLDLDGHVRIGDFGLSKPDMDVNEFAYSFCGSPEYMAPEMLLKVGHTYTVDYYCLGALLYELVTGLPPYYSHNTDEIYESILSEELTFPDHIKLSPELKNLLQVLLIKHPMQRMGQSGGIEEILKHQWFKKINIKDVQEKKITPPIKPDILSFNFDEEEFIKGEKEFKKKLIMCQLMQQEIGSSTASNIFKEFYFDATIKRPMYTSPQPLVNTLTQIQHDHVLNNIKNSNSNSNIQSQSQRGSKNSNNHTFIYNNSTSNTNHNTQNGKSSNQGNGKQNFFQNFSNSSNSRKMNQNSHNASPNVLSQKHSIQSTKASYSNMNGMLSQSQNQKKHLKNSNSLSTGMIIGPLSGLKKHIKSQSAMKFQSNNFMNNFVKQNTQQQSVGNSNQNTDINSSSQRMKTEEDIAYEDEKNSAYFSSANRVQTDTNRKQRTLIMKIQRKNSGNNSLQKSKIQQSSMVQSQKSFIPSAIMNNGNNNNTQSMKEMSASNGGNSGNSGNGTTKHYSPLGFFNGNNTVSINNINAQKA